jgi:N-acetylmuramic acid 6-phosphate etherase
MNLSVGEPESAVASSRPVPPPSVAPKAVLHAPLLRTEERHPASFGLDSMTSLEVLELMNREDAVSVAAAASALPRVAELVDLAVVRVRNGGSVHYFGAGTSGRLGVLDAAELKPTFHLEPGIVTAHIAGGPRAIVDSVERSEDSLEEGSDAAALGSGDLAIGLTASGTTPYVRGALTEARANGAATALITSNLDSPLAALADVFIGVDTGPEILTGSTRLKAGTAEKLVLNGFSTTLMVRLGRTWSNLMVSLVASNAKLRDRTVRILAEATGCSYDESVAALSASEGDLKVALVSSLAGVPLEEARIAVRSADDNVGRALETLRGTR